MEMTRETAVLVTLVTYKVLLIAIGFGLRRRQRSSSDYFLGGRSLGPFVAAISASASSSSAWTLLGVSGFAYTKGLSALWLFPSCVGGFLINWFWLAPRLRAHKEARDAVTVTELLAGDRREPWSKATAFALAGIVVSAFTIYVASQYNASAKTLDATFGLAFESAILIGGAIVILYTLLGGFWAVSVTDSVQGSLMALTALILPIAALAEVGGFTALQDGIYEVDVAGFGSLFRDLPLSAALGFVVGLLGIGLGYPGQPHVVNRFMALKEGGGELRRARLYAIVWAVATYSGMILLGLCGRVLLPDLVDGEKIFIHMTNDLFSPILSGIMLAAVLSAVMSTADSQLLAAASSATHDINPDAGGPAMVRRSRIVVAVIGCVAMAVAYMDRSSIFKMVLSAWTVVGAAVGPLLVVLLIRGSVRPAFRLAAVLTGFGSAVLLQYFGAEIFSAKIYPALKSVGPYVLAFGVAWWGATTSLSESRR